jgi:hypothetical protein
MPWAANGLANKEPIGERRAIMGAYGADRKDVFALAGEQHGFIAGMTGQHASVRKIVEGDALP